MLGRAFSFVITTRWILVWSALLVAWHLSASAEEYVGGEILVRFKTTTTESNRTDFERQERLVFLQEIPTVKVRLYRLPDGIEVLSAVERCKQHPFVEFAEPNHTRQLMGAPDPYYSQQWSLNNTGQQVNGVSGPAGVDIRWPQAMALFRGRTPVAVAVIDSGVAIDHKDIIDNYWVNTRELYGRTGVDDDGNGYVDDAIGWDFYAQDFAPLDENGHGTLVARVLESQNSMLAGQVFRRRLFRRYRCRRPFET